MFKWMLWTLPSAIGFGVIFAIILIVNIVDIFKPGYSRKGFLPISTTRGDRTFITLLCAILVFLLWMKFLPENSLPVSLAVVLPLSASLMIWG